MTPRFDMPSPGPPVAVRFPPIQSWTLENGLRVWFIAAAGAPVVTAALVLDAGSAADPADQLGLAALTADMLDEGAGGRDAIALADAFARLGTHLEVDVGPDVTTFGMTVVARHLADGLDLLADVICQPRLDDPDFRRVRELRVNRLSQLSRAPGSQADRAFTAAVFGGHPYGHGTVGLRRTLEAMTVEHARAFWKDAIAPDRATLIVGGMTTVHDVRTAAESAFGGWRASSRIRTRAGDVRTAADPTIRLVDRPGAPQSELRVGHVGPDRRTPAYHGLVTLNAVLGGQFSSRLNRNLRERRGVTYGARSSFDFRRAAGLFGAHTSVDVAATAESVAEILEEFRAIGEPDALEPVELARAQASLTRGYVRNFETADQLVRGAVELAAHDLGPETFDEFVPRVQEVSAAALPPLARRFVRPDECSVVVVGDADRCAASLEQLGRTVIRVTPEF